MKLKFILAITSGLLMFSNSYGQLHVSTGTAKWVLFEEGTGAWCGYCPDGAQRIEQTIKPANTKVNYISWHGDIAHGEPVPLMISGDPYNSNTNYDSLGFPSAVIDRVPFDPFGTGATYSQNRGGWASDVTSRLTATANFQVDMKSTFDTSTRLLTVIVTGKALVALTGTWNINAYITEDSLSSITYPQHSYLYTQTGSWYLNQCASACPGYTCSACAVLPDTIYSHMEVARAYLAANFWGDAAFTNPAVNTTASKTYTYTVPAGYNWKHMKVIGLVSKYGTTQYDRATENSITALLRWMPKSAAGVPTVQNMTSIELFPNPAQHTISVKGMLDNPTETKIVVFNTLGQSLLEKHFPAGSTTFAESIQLGGIANGVYFMHIINNGQTVVKRFVVNK